MEDFITGAVCGLLSTGFLIVSYVLTLLVRRMQGISDPGMEINVAP
jgi:hypothetical protein